MTSFTESHFFDGHFALLPLAARPILTKNPEPRLREFLVENNEEPPDAAVWFNAKSRWTLRVRPLLPLQTDSVARHLLQVFDELALGRGKSSWVEKTPRHLRYIPFIQRVSGRRLPTSFVHVIRDGLEVVASLHGASQSWEQAYDLETCVRRWNADVGFSLARALTTADHFVFYEELTSQPEATLRSLLTGLGLGWEPDILERYTRTSERLVTQQEAWKVDVGRSIRPSGTSDKVLTRAQRDRVTQTLRQDLYDQLRERAGQPSKTTGGARG
jgi:hypothetical protein